MKQISIKLENCLTCPYLQRYGRIARPYCFKKGSFDFKELPSVEEIQGSDGKRLIPTGVIPTWCPLEDAK